MSLSSKFKQFANWVGEHVSKPSDFSSDTFPQSQPTGWSEGETQAINNAFQEGAKNWRGIGLFVASYLDSKIGLGKPLPPGSGPITGNNNNDALIIVGGSIAAVGVVWYIFKKFF